MYIKRKLEQKVLQTSKHFPVVLVTGPRQVGKTTMLKKLSSSDRKYITLDNPLIRNMAQNDPSLFLQRYSPPVLIDEIQYAPQLLPYIKMYVDENKVKGDFWLTGSQMFHLMKGVSESLAGRVGIINLLGFSNGELEGTNFGVYSTYLDSLLERKKVATKQDLHKVFGRIHKGSMPALYETKQPNDEFYYSYINTYLERDVRDLSQVGDLGAFLNFLTNCAARTSQMVNYTELANDVGITSPTARKWLSILVTSGIVYLLQPYHNNALKRMVKAPNMYFMDTGLCAYLTKWTTSEALEVSAMSGAFFETYVVTEIIKSYYYAGKEPPLYYYRDCDKKEIDLLIHQNGTLYPIEIKKSGNPKNTAIKNFSVLYKTKMIIGHGNVICLADDIYPIDKNNSIVPVWLI